MLAILIIFHHLSLYFEDTFFYDMYAACGMLYVGVFFFLSGYGLTHSYRCKNDYLKGFLKKRLSAILVPYVLVMVLYWLELAAYGQIYGVRTIAKTYESGYPLVSNSWYVVAIFFYYVFFWVIARISQKLGKQIILPAAFGFCIAWIFVCRGLGWGTWWYTTIFGIWAGSVWGVYEEQILRVVKQHYWRVFAASAALFAVAWALHVESPDASDTVGVWIYIISCEIAVCAFSVLMVCLGRKISLHSPALKWLGTISYEIYLLHGLFLSVWRSGTIYIRTDAVWIGAVFASTLVAGWLVHMLSQKLIKMMN
jgi:peptidoglycan/LPS O-acetylase OafA/YrhL